MTSRSLLVVLAVFLSGCPESACPLRPVAMKSPDINEPVYCQNFTSTLVTKNQSGQQISQFALGQPVSIESTVTNNSSSTVTITKASGCPQVGFEAYSTEDTPNIVWSSADGIACTQATESATFAAGETKTFSAEWDQAACGGAQAPAGQYKVRTQDTTECWAHIDQDVSLTLE